MEGEVVDIIFNADQVKQASQDGVEYYIKGTDSDNEPVIVTVFNGNCPDIDFRQNTTYKITDGIGEKWDDGTPGVKTGYNTSVKKLEPDSSTDATEVVGNEIENGDLVDIALQVDSIDYGDSPLAYHAWCRDEIGETVVLTVFEDQEPETTLEEEQWYVFRRVDGERWDDGTPGIKLNNYSQVDRASELDKETGQSQDQIQIQNQNTGSDPLVIDTVLNEPEEMESFTLFDNRYLTFILSGLATAVAIGASLFAPDLGLAATLVFFIAGTAFAVGAAYITNYNPASRLRHRRQRKHIRLFLELLIRDYQKMTDNDSDIRANVMVSDKSLLSRLRIRPKTLSILSCAGGYKDSEVELEYNLNKRAGNCGRAYTSKEKQVYDSNKFPENNIDLEDVHRDLTEETNSILSIPIKITEGHDRRMVGVLSIDSTSSIEETKFDTKDVQNLAYRYADMIGDVLR